MAKKGGIEQLDDRQRKAMFAALDKDYVSTRPQLRLVFGEKYFSKRYGIVEVREKSVSDTHIVVSPIENPKRRIAVRKDSLISAKVGEDSTIDKLKHDLNRNLELYEVESPILKKIAKPLPEFWRFKPVMLATSMPVGELEDEVFKSKRWKEVIDTWSMDRKYDGVRLDIHASGKNVKIFSRSGRDVSGAFPEIVRDIASRNFDNVILDAEGVNKNNYDDQSFRGRINRVNDVAKAMKELPAIAMTFDIRMFKGKSTEGMTLNSRRKLLSNILSESTAGNIARVPVANGLENMKKMWERAKSEDWEGIVLKDKDETYSRKRSKDWLKVKMFTTADVVITGMSFGTGKRKDTFGALSMAVYNNVGKLIPIGSVGTGFDEGTLERLRPLVIKHRGRLVAEVKYQRLGAGGKLVLPVFKDLRDDKKAKSCTFKSEFGINK